MFKAWQRITLWKRVIIGMLIGVAIGLTLRYGIGQEYSMSIPNFMPGAETDSIQFKLFDFGVSLFKPLGDAFVRLIKMLVIPLVFTTLVAGVTAMGDPKKLGSLGSKTIALYLLTTLFAVSLGLAIGTIVKPGKGVNYQANQGKTVEEIQEILEDEEQVKASAIAEFDKADENGDGVQSDELKSFLPAYSADQIEEAISSHDIDNDQKLNQAEFDTLYVESLELQLASAKAKEAVNTKLKKAADSGGFVQRLLDIIPTNPAAALAAGDVLPTIFFAIMVGIGILVCGSVADPVKNFFEAAAEVVMQITMMVMELAPLGVLALMAWVMATQGIEVLVNLGWLAFALYLACFLQIVFVYGGLIVGLFLRLPLISFFRGVADAQGVAFSTASSSATLPMTINCAEKNLGVKKSVASSVLPLGATINMDGTAIYLGLIALFAAQAAGMDLTWTQYVMVAMTATLVSIGAAGIPSAGLLLAATVLDVIGVTDAQAVLVIAFIFPFDRLLDMMRTVTNVTGDIAVACTVAKWEGDLDPEVFRAPPVTKS